MTWHNEEKLFGRIGRKSRLLRHRAKFTASRFPGLFSFPEIDGVFWYARLVLRNGGQLPRLQAGNRQVLQISGGIQAFRAQSDKSRQVKVISMRLIILSKTKGVHKGLQH